jgi:hypothetical protein
MMKTMLGLFCAAALIEVNASSANTLVASGAPL